MADIANMDKLGSTTAKLMERLEKFFEAPEFSGVSIERTLVVVEMRYHDDGIEQSHVMLECDDDSRITQIGLSTAAQNAALWGEALDEEEDE